MPRHSAPSAPAPRPSAPREKLLATAARLFARHGIQAVGIDRILAEAGVAKMTLYRHFASKDELVSAYLDRMDGEFWRWVESSTAAASMPEERLVALLDAVSRYAVSPECLGCAFQGAAVAFPEPDHPGHERALRHKRTLRERLASLAREAGLRDPDGLAAELLLLMDGAWVAARIFGARDSPAPRVGQAGRALVEAHRPARSRRTASRG